MREVNKILILWKFLKRLVVVARLCRPRGRRFALVLEALRSQE
jgi:hypothetical protein